MASDGTKKQRSSKTADMAAAARAFHRIRVSPPVFDDFLAIDFCGRFWRTVLSSSLLTRIVIDGLLGALLPVVQLIVARARYGEDGLMEEIANGVDQYVIVGAGHDTFAFRRPDVLEKLTVYEVDHPATQATKLERVRRSGLSAPQGLNFVAVDLNEINLFDALADAGFDHTRPAVFAWFGVTYYLTVETIAATLKGVSERAAAGSTIMFDYQADPSRTPAADQELQRKTAEFVAKRGEPWKSSFDPDRLVEFVGSCGLREIQHLPPGQLKGSRFTDNTDFLVPAFFGLCSARV